MVPASPILLTRAARLAVEHCAQVAKGDRCLVICDKTRWAEGEAIAGTILALGAMPLLVDVSHEVARYLATNQRPEPPDHMAAAFAASTFVFAVTDVEYCHILGHTAKNQVAQSAGMQYILVEEDLAGWTTTPEDIDVMYNRTLKTTDLMSKGKTVSLKTTKGTDVRFQLKPGRKVWNFAARTPDRREALILPNYAESACVPWEGTAQGRAIIDGFIIGVGPVTEPVEFIIENGRIVKVNGGASASKLKAIMDAADENAYNIAECGVCTSHKEKRPYEYEGKPNHFSYGAWGSVHLGIGHSQAIGGDVFSKIHLDCQIYDATLCVDDVCVMENGKYQY